MGNQTNNMTNNVNELVQTQIEQKESVNNFVKEGKDWNGKRIPKNLIELSLKFEKWVCDNSEFKLFDGFSDYPPSYVLCKKRVNPIEHFSETQREYYKVLEILPRIIKNKECFMIRDYRVLSPFKLQIGVFVSFEELIETITHKNYGIDIMEYMRIKELNSFDSNTIVDKMEVLSIEL